jgi:hypothetical protein
MNRVACHFKDELPDAMDEPQAPSDYCRDKYSLMKIIIGPDWPFIKFFFRMWFYISNFGSKLRWRL